MKRSDLAPVLMTHMEVMDRYGNPTGVVFTGHTPISPEFIAARQRINPPTKSTTLIIGKKGESRMQINNDPKAADKRVQLLAEVTTSVEGLDDFDPEKESMLDLFRDPVMAGAVQQWEDHLDDEGKHSPPPEQSAKRTSKSSAG